MSAALREPPLLSASSRWGVLFAAFLAWFFAGVQMSITPLVSNSVTIDLLGVIREGEVYKFVPKEILTSWYARYNATFLFGAATGGILFGWFGDTFGRSRALGLSVCCYSIFTGLASLVNAPEWFIAFRFIGCLGVGGVWPNAIALASEVWAGVSRPILSGIIGTAANVGLVAVGVIALRSHITAESWRWVMVLGSTPLVLGIAILLLVPESPKWLASQRDDQEDKKPATPVREVFRPPLLYITLLGLLLGTVPMFGGWGCTNWLVPWADGVGANTDPGLKAKTQIARSVGAAISSLIGGWVAARIGRRLSYFLFSLASLVIGQIIFQYLNPLHPWFNFAVFLLGTTTGFYFGWLPLCLPELFPTRVRSTGAGVTFNFGRIATAFGVLAAGYISTRPFIAGDYAKVGAITSLVFAVGMIVIWFMPRHAGKELD